MFKYITLLVAFISIQAVAAAPEPGPMRSTVVAVKDLHIKDDKDDEMLTHFKSAVRAEVEPGVYLYLLVHNSLEKQIDSFKIIASKANRTADLSGIVGNTMYEFQIPKDTFSYVFVQPSTVVEYISECNFADQNCRSMPYSTLHYPGFADIRVVGGLVYVIEK